MFSRRITTQRGPRRPATRLPFCPRVEALEGRALPSTFTVQNLANSGAGSLRAAVLAAETNPGPDVIEFARGVTGTITLTRGELLIRDGLAIRGPGAERLTISGNDSSRIFDVVGGGDESTRITVSISGLTVSHGRADRGGGIQNQGVSDLSLTGLALSGNVAVGQPDLSPAAGP